MAFPFGGVMPNWPAGDHMVNNIAVALTPPGCTGPNAAAIKSIMASVLSGGMASVLSNPVAAANAALQTAASGAATALTSALGGSAATLVAAITGSGPTSLLTALTSHLSYSNALAGVSTPSTGQYGPLDMVQHAMAARQFFGTPGSEPSGVSVASATAPLTVGADFATMQTQISDLVSSVIADPTTMSAAVSTATAMAAQVQSTVTSSQSSISTMQNALPALATVMTLAGAVASTSGALNSVGSILAQSGSPLASLASHIASMSAPSSSETAAMTSFPDSSAAQPGAKGGMA